MTLGGGLHTVSADRDISILESPHDRARRLGLGSNTECPCWGSLVEGQGVVKDSRGPVCSS